MQVKLSYEDLKSKLPGFVERAIERASSVKDNNFDGTTDPAGWKWVLNMYDDFKSNNVAESIYMGIMLNETNDIKKERNIDYDKMFMIEKDFVKKYLDEGLIHANVCLSMGGNKVYQEPVTTDNEIPEELVNLYKLNEYPPVKWEGKTISVFKRLSHFDHPGVAKEGIVAVFEKEDSSLILLRDPDPNGNKLVVSSLDENANVIVTEGLLSKESTVWDVAEGSKWGEWKRIPVKEIESRIGSIVFSEKFMISNMGRIANGELVTTVLSSDKYALNENPKFDVDTITDEIPQFEYGEKLSDRQQLKQKWAIFDNRKEIVEEAALFNTAVAMTKMPNLNEVIQTGNTEGLRTLIKEFKENGYLEKAFTNDGENNHLTQMLFMVGQTGNPEMLQMLIDLGAEIDVIAYRKSADSGRMVETTVFENVLHAGNEKNIEWFIEKGYAKIDGADNSGQPWITVALMAGSTKSADKLLSLGANINEYSFLGNTPLHIASSEGNPVAIQWLIENGADGRLESSTGALPAEMVPDGDQWNSLYDYLEDYRIALQNGEKYTLPDSFYTDFDLVNPNAPAIVKHEDDGTDPEASEQKKLDDFLAAMGINVKKPSGPSSK